MSTTADDWEEPDDNDAMLETPLRFVARILLVLIVASVVLYGCASVHAGDDLDDWLRQRAEDSKEWYGVIVFSAEWCGPCRGQKQALDAMAKDGWITRHRGECERSHFVLADWDFDKDLVAKYGTPDMKLPYFVAVKGGVVVERYEGVLGTPDMRALWWKAKGVR